MTDNAAHGSSKQVSKLAAKRSSSTARGVAKPKKAKAPANHPKYLEMVVGAINALKERNGSSRQAILRYLLNHYNVGKETKFVNTHLKLALKRGITSGVLKHAKGQGASGSFRVSADKSEKSSGTFSAPKKATKPVAKSSKTVVDKSTIKVEKVKTIKVDAKKPKVKATEKKLPVATTKLNKKKEKEVKSPKKTVEKKKKATAVKAKKPKSPKKSPAKKTAAKAKVVKPKPKKEIKVKASARKAAARK